MSESRSEFEAAQDDEVWAAFCDMKKDGQKIQIEDVLAFGNRCWKSSRRAALEEAAKVCDAQAAEHDKHHHEHDAMAAESCAAAIRELDGETEEG